MALATKPLMMATLVDQATKRPRFLWSLIQVSDRLLYRKQRSLRRSLVGSLNRRGGAYSILPSCANSGYSTPDLLHEQPYAHLA